MILFELLVADGEKYLQFKLQRPTIGLILFYLKR